MRYRRTYPQPLPKGGEGERGRAYDDAMRQSMMHDVLRNVSSTTVNDALFIMHYALTKGEGSKLADV